GNRNSASSTTRRDRVLVSKLWVDIKKARDHREVTCDQLGRFGLQSLQLITGSRMQVFWRDLVWDLRVVVFASHRPKLVLQALCFGKLASAAATVAPAAATSSTSARLRAIAL